MPQDPTPRGPFAEVAPPLDDYTSVVLFGDVWEGRASRRCDIDARHAPAGPVCA